MATKQKTGAESLAEKLEATGTMALTEDEATELRRMVRQIQEFLIVLRVGDECRSSDPNGQRICGPCWTTMVNTAVDIDPPPIIEGRPV